MSNNKLTSMEIDAIGEILNISLGASATAASTMLNARVDITTPVVEIKSKDEFEFANLEPAVGVEITYVEGLTGSNVMLLKRWDVKVIVEKMMGMEIPEEEFELNELNISAICEVMNQMMGASSTALAELLSRTVNISTPVSFEVETTEQFVGKYFTDNEPMVVIRFDLKIGDEMQSEFMNVMPTGLAKELVSGFFPDGAPDAEPEPEPAAAPEPAPTAASGGEDKVMDQAAIEALLASAATEDPVPAPAPEPAPAAPSGGEQKLDQDAIEALLAANTASEPTPAAPAAQPTPAAPAAQPVPPAVDPAAAMAAAPAAMTMDPNATMAASSMMMQQMMDMMRQQMELQRQELEELRGMYKNAAAPRQIKVNPMPSPNLGESEAMADPDANLDLIMGVPLDVSVEIGRTKKLVRDILEFNKGSLVVLNKLAGEQVDIFVNGQCIAKGDVVVVEDNFGVRITEILQEEILLEQQG
ncbi:MAG: flagellar motor switch protein FliN [Firmicutes bacterium]|jgi:flagellar motor switch protein FliN/FliY|nr:flagellar motor switch protein FliN [Bacillota bacterium]